MKYRYCLFDLDGTLTDPAIGITNSVMHALEKYDIHVADRSELYPFIGPPLDYSFKTFYGFSDEQAVQAIKYYREYFSVTGLFENKVYDGIPEMLEALKDKGVKIALATSKPHEFSVRILEHFDLMKYFDHVGAATMDGRISKKADVISNLLNEMGAPAKDEILMVGDRYHDIEGAKANGLKSAGVLWGYGSKEELQNAGAEYILSEPSEIPELFKFKGDNMKNLQLTNDDYLGYVNRLRHACRGIVVRDSKVLLSYESKNDKYMIPGGGVEEDENYAECCEREILEETGMKVRATEEYLEIEELFLDWKHINHYFVCDFIEDTGKQDLTEGEKAAGYEAVWVPLDDAVKMFSEYERFHQTAIEDYGLYRREYIALKEYVS